MKILSVYYTHKPGGLCHRLYRLLNALARSGNEVVYLSLDRPPNGSIPFVRWQQVPFLLKSRSGIFFWGLFTFWLPIYLSWFCFRTKPDRFVVFGAYYAAASRIGAVVASSKLILFLRAFSPTTHKILAKSPLIQTISNLWEGWGVRGADKVVVMTETMKKDVQLLYSVSNDRFKVLPNNLPVARIDDINGAGIPREIAAPIRVLTAGVLDSRKNVGLILNAVDFAHKKVGKPFIELTVAGTGPDRARLERKVLEQGIQGVTFLGWVENLYDQLHSYDLLVHASLHEGMPNIVMESLSKSMPVLLGSAPELRELAGENSSAIFSDSDPSDLGEKLIALNEQPKRLEQLRLAWASRAVDFVFNWDSRAVEIVAEA